MTSLVHNLGLSKKLAFHDVYSIDDPDLLAFVPRPAYALLLVFPVNAAYTSARQKEDASKEEYGGKGREEPVVWFKQTIRNACGLIGLLHGVANGGARDFVGMFFVMCDDLRELKVSKDSANGVLKSRRHLWLYFSSPPSRWLPEPVRISCIILLLSKVHMLLLQCKATPARHQRNRTSICTMCVSSSRLSMVIFGSWTVVERVRWTGVRWIAMRMS
jgi:ubiquitin carboxyl-terminal hydrolase L3